MRNDILRLENLFKNIDSYPVLRGVSFCLEAGRGLCVVTDNYDTQKTLIRILSGECRPDAGRIYVDDRAAQLRSPEEAWKQGIFFADSGLMISTMSVAANLFLTNDEYYSSCGVTSAVRMQKDSEGLLREYGIRWMSPADKLKTRQLGNLLIVSILKAVTLNARVIVLDDVCGQLSEKETERLQQVCEKVKQKGIGILYIANQLNRRFRIFDEVSVIRNHVTVGTFPAGRDIEEQLLWMYESRTKLPASPGPGREQGPAVLEAENLRPHGTAGTKAISFRLYKKEILGICDRQWSTLPLFRSALKGETDCGGKLLLDGCPLRLFGKNPLFDYKIALVSGDERKRRVFDQMSIYDNITIMQKDLIYNKLGIINRRYQRYMARYCLELIHEEDMLRRYGRKKELRKMSIRDQLKLEVARWLCVRPRVFVFYKPCDSFQAFAPRDFQNILADIQKLQIPVLILSDHEDFLQQFCDRISDISQD